MLNTEHLINYIPRLQRQKDLKQNNFTLGSVLINI